MNQRYLQHSVAIILGVSSCWHEAAQLVEVQFCLLSPVLLHLLVRHPRLDNKSKSDKERRDKMNLMGW